jgi:hypothetical protein
MIQRRAYVQCLPEYLVINTASHRVVMAYQRINTIQPVQVGRVYDIKAIKGREKLFIKPLQSENALEVQISEYPVSEKRLRRNFSRFVLNPRNKGFIFIVKYPQQLGLELSTFQDHSRSRRSEEQSRYLDPIERLQYQNPSKTF